MTTTKLLLTAWDFEWSINLGCAAMLAVYFWKVEAELWRRCLFVLGVVVMLLALESPIDTLGDTYLFSAHMAQHLLLILMVSPLLVLSMPAHTVRNWLRVPWIAKIESVLSRPVVAWVLGMGTLTVWHVPVLYNFALAHEVVHIFQHLSFLVTATIFWWPVLHPIAERRLQTGPAILYLFAAVAENSVLGIILTFMRAGHYPEYLHPVDELGALHLIRDGWGISPQYDQRLGGLFMWIPGCLVYFIVILGRLAHWYAQPDMDGEMTGGFAAQGGGR